MKYNFFLLCFLLSFCFEKPRQLNNLITSKNTANIILNNGYVKLFLKTSESESIDTGCFGELYYDLSRNDLIETDKKYPWLIDYIGKGLNDLGDEIECNKSILNTTYIIATINSLAYIYPQDETLLHFLEIKNFAFGICIINECEQKFKMYFKRVIDVIYTVSDNQDKTENKEILNFDDFEENTNSYKEKIIIFFLFYIILTIIIGILRLIFIPKGYDKYVAGLLQSEGKLDNIDVEEKKSFFERNANNEILMNEELDYKSFFDLGAYFPFKLRIIRFFDFFNDVFLLT